MQQQFIIFSFIFFTLIPSFSQAQSKTLSSQVNLVFGMSQLAAGGFNAEVNVAYGRFIFDYSHGVSLNFPRVALGGADEAQGLALHMPWTTGLGIGYRLNDWLNIRLEPKWHQFDYYYEGDAQIPENLVGGYSTFTLGLGAYANLRPFKNKENFLKGFMIVPNIRWWPRISSSQEGGQFSYINRNTEQLATHEVRQIGIGNTPFFANVSLGYSLTF